MYIVMDWTVEKKKCCFKKYILDLNTAIKRMCQIKTQSSKYHLTLIFFILGRTRYQTCKCMPKLTKVRCPVTKVACDPETGAPGTPIFEDMICCRDKDKIARSNRDFDNAEGEISKGHEKSRRVYAQQTKKPTRQTKYWWSRYLRRGRFVSTFNFYLKFLYILFTLIVVFRNTCTVKQDNFEVNVWYFDILR